MTTMASNSTVSPGIVALVEDFAASAGSIESAVTVPPACYTDPAFYDFEKDAVFRRSWLYVCHASEVAQPGDQLAITVAGEPLVITRDQQGALHALSAVCRHRSYPLLEDETTNGRHLRCPYHYWTYALDGRLIAAPDMGLGRDLDLCLPRYALEEWHGFVFVSFDPAAQPLAPTLEPLHEEFATYRPEDLIAARSVDLPDLRWNWKNMLENALEEYHTTYIHRGYHEAAPARLVEHLPFEESSDNAIIRHANFVDPERGFLTEGGQDPFPLLPHVTPAQRGRVLYAAVPPTMFASVKRDSAMIFRILPDGVDRMRLTVTWLFPQSTIDLPDFDPAIERLIGFFEVINGQDMTANERIYRGLRSAEATRGPYSPYEESLLQLNRWLLRRYRAQLAG